MNRQRSQAALLTWLSCFWIVGCAEAELATVNGTVTLDGQPLQQGSIQFAPVDGQAPSQAAKIEGGKFTALLQRTKYQVRISAPKITKTLGNPDQYGPGDASTVEELLPHRYNIRSELTLDVTEAADDVRFELKSK